MHRLVAIDPGTFESAYVVMNPDTRVILDRGQADNQAVLVWLEKQRMVFGSERLVIEMIKSYGNAMGDSTIETCVWIGRFIERWSGPVDKLPRKTIVTTLCMNPRANDSNVRRALLDMYTPAKVKGFTRDMWSALAVATAWTMMREERRMARRKAGLPPEEAIVAEAVLDLTEG
jgi:hypothetical protein